MAGILDDLVLGLDDDDKPVLLLAGQEITSLADLFGATSGDLSETEVRELARAANHLCRAYAYRVITDAATFSAAFRDRRRSEDTQAPWQEGAPQLTDFAEPALDVITDPEITAGKLVYFAEDNFTGMPYAIEVPLDAPNTQAAIYAPLPPADIE